MELCLEQNHGDCICLKEGLYSLQSMKLWLKRSHGDCVCLKEGLYSLQSTELCLEQSHEDCVCLKEGLYSLQSMELWFKRSHGDCVCLKEGLYSLQSMELCLEQSHEDCVCLKEGLYSLQSMELWLKRSHGDCVCLTEDLYNLQTWSSYRDIEIVKVNHRRVHDSWFNLGESDWRPDSLCLRTLWCLMILLETDVADVVIHAVITGFFYRTFWSISVSTNVWVLIVDRLWWRDCWSEWCIQGMRERGHDDVDD